MSTPIKLVLVLMLLSSLVSCSAIRQSPLIQERTIQLTDTIYLSNVQYDSIYVYQERDRDYHRGIGTLEHGTLEPDTIFIKDVSVEYRYKLLHDTIERVKIEIQRDSIPYEVRVVETKEVPRKRNWLDTFSLTFFFILQLGTIIYILSLLRGHWKL